MAGGGVNVIMATVVKAKSDEPADSVIRRFKKQVLVDDILMEIRKREFYKKPSQEKQERRKERDRLRRRIQKLSY